MSRKDMSGTNQHIHVHPASAFAPMSARKNASASSSGVEIVDSADGLAVYQKEIEELADFSQDTNTQFEYTTLVSALKHLQRGKKARVALIWNFEEGINGRQLIGLLPFHVPIFQMLLPLKQWSSWQHIHSFISTPLLKSGYEITAVEKYLNAAWAHGASLVQFPEYQGDGAFDHALSVVAAQHALNIRETDIHHRAFLSSGLDSDSYIATHIRKKKRKEFNRLWNRLSELGTLDFVTHNGGEKAQGWVDTFLSLEASGWKGARGTAMQMRPNEKAYFTEICLGSHRAGKLHCTEMLLDGKPIAMLTSFRAGNGLYTFKIAFDEEYARYSPGTLLMLKLIHPCLDDPKIDWVDSCAIPDHPMIDHIWAERRPMRSVIVGRNTISGRISLSLGAGMMKLQKTAREHLKTVYYKIRKEMGNGKAD